MLAALREFAELYEHRPIRDNDGGMRAPHMFAAWFMLRSLRPEAVIESGVWRGQGTWLIEQACPDAALFCAEPNIARIEYRSPRAQYLNHDVKRADWSASPAETVLFSDDHQNAPARLGFARRWGFRHVIFEDNYPVGRGDCRSLKQELEKPRWWRPDLRGRLGVYAEFPPVVKVSETRFGDPWDGRYPTEDPLLTDISETWQQVFVDEAQAYTWMCYARLAQ